MGLSIGEFEDEWRGIRNQVRKFDPYSILVRCVHWLHHPGTQPVCGGLAPLLPQYEPWNLFLILEHVFLYGDFSAGHIRLRQIDEPRFNRLLNRVKHLRRFQDPRKFKRLELFFKNLAFEQFWYQRGLDRAQVARPAVLFLDSDSRSQFEVEFAADVGIPLSEYLELAFALSSRFIQSGHDSKPPYVSVRDFEAGFSAYGESTITRLLDFVSRTPDGVRASIESERRSVRNPVLRLFSPTPLKTFPLLRLSGRYLCYSPIVLMHRLMDLPYDVLGLTSNPALRKLFGRRFEDYVGEVLAHLGRQVLTENDIKKRWQSSGKVVDFAVPYAKGTVLVEAKGIELTELAQVSDDADVVARSLKSTVIKALNQAATTARVLSGDPVGSGGEPVVGAFYCLVVTYKRIYLGTAKDLVGQMTVGERQKLLHEYNASEKFLPLENIYIIPVEDVEHLVAIESLGGTDVVSVLREAVVEDADPTTRMFDLGLRLNRYSADTWYLPRMTSAFSDICNRALRKFRGDGVQGRS